MSTTLPTASPALDLLRRGDLLGAERAASEAVRAAEERHGVESVERAAALSDLAKVLLGARDLGRAASALRAASAVTAPGPEAEKLRLTALMNLGEVLIMAGALDEAEEVVRRGLEARGRFYGEDHAGYAYGLLPLAKLLLRRDRPAEALALAERAHGIFWEEGNPEAATSLAVRALARHAAGAIGDGEGGYQGLETLPAELVQRTVHTSLALAQHLPLAATASALRELRGWIEALRGEDDPWLVPLAAAGSHAAAQAGDAAGAAQTDVTTLGRLR